MVDGDHWLVADRPGRRILSQDAVADFDRLNGAQASEGPYGRPGHETVNVRDVVADARVELVLADRLGGIPRGDLLEDRGLGRS